MSITENLNNENKNLTESNCYLKLPSKYERFINTETVEIKDKNDRVIYNFRGYVELLEEECDCPCCHHEMKINDSYDITLKSLPYGDIYTILTVNRKQLICPWCGFTKMQDIPFKDKNHLITNALRIHIEDLLKINKFTNKDIAYLSGVNRNIVKDIDKERLQQLYTIEGKGEELIQPEEQARYLGIDEFKLHNGYKYATHIIDYDTGHILWIQEGKKKQVVYDFIEHVGMEWMKHVKAVACDMNSDFEEAFKEKCPHLEIVYDHFHIVKNFNEKVVGEIRKEEQARLTEMGDKKAAERLKHSKFILTSNEYTLAKKDKEAEEGKIVNKGSKLFNTSEVKAKGGKLSKYQELINNNELFLIIALIKELLQEAYLAETKEDMAELIFDIMDLCESNGNKHFVWFKNLLYNHFDGIISYADHRISSGRIEGINNKIKTLRRQAYGLPDDEYFFLKLFDASRV